MCGCSGSVDFNDRSGFLNSRLILNQSWLCVTVISTVPASTRTLHLDLDHLFPSSQFSLADMNKYTQDLKISKRQLR